MLTLYEQLQILKKLDSKRVHDLRKIVKELIVDNVIRAAVHQYKNNSDASIFTESEKRRLKKIKIKNS